MHLSPFPLAAARTHIQANLSPERAKHCQAVAEEMGCIAKQYVLNRDQAIFVGLMHDIGKEIPRADMLELVRINNPSWWSALPEDCRQEIYLHDPAGAILAKRLFPTLDEATIGAIRDHVLNDPDLPMLTRCLRVADMVRPVTDFPGRKTLEHLLHAGELNMANLILDMFGYAHFKKAGLAVWPKIIQHHAELEHRLGHLPPSIQSLLAQ